jgi:hypothetical protein
VVSLEDFFKGSPKALTGTHVVGALAPKGKGKNAHSASAPNLKIAKVPKG